MQKDDTNVMSMGTGVNASDSYGTARDARKVNIFIHKKKNLPWRRTGVLFLPEKLERSTIITGSDRACAFFSRMIVRISELSAPERYADML